MEPSSLSTTFVAALRSVGTAATMAMAGFYLHRKKFITPEGKKALARMSQQVTIPALFFTKIIHCPQDFSPEPCPNITDKLSDVWVLSLWPFFVVGCGLLVGEMAARISSTPPWQRRQVIAACAFANSTGLPITLLTVVHANFPATTELGAVDPNLFLSVYLLLYPVLQWGIGGWLLAPSTPSTEEKSVLDGDRMEKGGALAVTSTLSHHSKGIHHVLNVHEGDGDENKSVSSSAAATMIRELSLSNLTALKPRREDSFSSLASTAPSSIMLADEGSTTIAVMQASQGQLAVEKTLQAKKHPEERQLLVATETTALANPPNDVAPLTETLAKVLPKALQPPVVGALLGLFIASIPGLRGIFVDLQNRADSAPLEWFFDGLYSIGQAAVPINMTILGVNLSMTMQSKQSHTNTVTSKTLAAIVVGKMIVMPLIGISAAVVLRNYLWSIPEDIDASFYLVLMMVTITPTANTVMVMVELSGSGSKEGVARIIGWQYAVAPILLSITVMLVVRVACLW